jgi:hypothetical protein
MTADRRMRLWSLIVEHAQGGPVTVEHVCAAVMSATGVDGVAVTVVLSTGSRETVYASDQVASDLEELTLTLGEGPGGDAVAGRPALVADLTAPECLARWPVFAPAAAHTGVRAVFRYRVQRVHRFDNATVSPTSPTLPTVHRGSTRRRSANATGTTKTTNRARPNKRTMELSRNRRHPTPEVPATPVLPRGDVMSVLHRIRNAPADPATTMPPRAPAGPPARPAPSTPACAAWISICTARAHHLHAAEHPQRRGHLPVDAWHPAADPGTLIADVGESILAMVVGATRITQLRRLSRQGH